MNDLGRAWVYIKHKLAEREKGAMEALVLATDERKVICLQETVKVIRDLYLMEESILKKE